VRAQDYIDGLSAVGRNAFTTDAALEALGGGEDAVRAQLRRLKQRGRIASPMRSFHVVVPPEYRALGCVPAEHFIDQLMHSLGEPYYVGLLSAAARHGAAHQRPQSLQVMVPRNRALVRCGQVQVHFVARHDVERMPVANFNTPHGYIRYATPELTALELVGYPKHAGGISNVATVLAELVEAIDGLRLVAAAALCPVGWAQRLGYLLELVDAGDLAASLEPFVQTHANSYIPLRRAQPVAGASRDSRWRVIVNVEVEPDE
jgi:predicted transcriptional regulator of viral defense system